MSLGVCPRASPDNQRPNKHVESTLVSCLDPGSIPGSSTLLSVAKGGFKDLAYAELKVDNSII